MYRNKTIGIVVPAYNEEALVVKTIRSIPDYVDKIIVVDDCSTDRTLDALRKTREVFGKRLIIIRHMQNRGVGGSIVTGYREAIALKLDLAGVMAGDNQMDPNDLAALIDPIIDEKIDYTKGNRLLHKSVKSKMPKYRYLGNSILTILNKIATGYWHVMDPQCGYTVTTREVLETIPLSKIYQRYGVPNDILTKLNVFNFKVKDVIVYPVYKDEKSKIRLKSYIPKVSLLLLKCFLFRLKEKYLLRDFHPLVFFYLFSFLVLPIGIIYSIYLLVNRLYSLPISLNAVILTAILLITGFQSLFFGMLFDMEYNRNRD